MKLINLTDDTFDNFLKSNKKVLVKATMENCPPCKVITPILETLADENEDISFCEFDAPSCPALTKNFKIKGVPHTMFFKDGELVYSLTGSVSKQKLIQMLKL